MAEAPNTVEVDEEQDQPDLAGILKSTAALSTTQNPVANNPSVAASAFWQVTPSTKPLEVRAIQHFLTTTISMHQMSPDDSKRVCATLQALTWRI